MRIAKIKSGENGSIPLVLLAAVVLGGVVIILFGVVRSGQISVRADRDFANAIQVADAGIQQAYAQIRTLDEDDDITHVLTCGGVSQPACTGTLADGTAFEWTYEQTGSASFEIESRGMAGDEMRILTTTIEADLEFVADLIAVSTLSMRGREPVPPVSVATFCNAEIRGAATSGISLLTLLDGVDSSPCEVSSSPGHALDHLKPFPTAEGPQITDVAAAFCEQYAGMAPSELPGDVRVVDLLPIELERGVSYCALQARSRHTLSDDSGLTGDDRVVRVYLYDGSYSGNVISLAGGDHMNWPASASTNDVEATDLRIWIANGGGDVRLTGNSRIAATITAPYSTCRFTGNNGRVKGAVFCNNVETRGHFSPDDVARGLRAGELNIQGIDEQFLPS